MASAVSLGTPARGAWAARGSETPRSAGPPARPLADGLCGAPSQPGPRMSLPRVGLGPPDQPLWDLRQCHREQKNHVAEAGQFRTREARTRTERPLPAALHRVACPSARPAGPSVLAAAAEPRARPVWILWTFVQPDSALFFFLMKRGSKTVSPHNFGGRVSGGNKGTCSKSLQDPARDASGRQQGERGEDARGPRS